MSTKFTKMNSQGNDFIIIDLAQEKFTEDQDAIKKICSRDVVGCDQLLLINTTDPKRVTCKIYNNDGTSASQCGNGMRAIMLYLNKKFSITESIINVCELEYKTEVIDKNRISVELGQPSFAENSLPQDSIFTSELEMVNVGNTHAIVSKKIDEKDRNSIADALDAGFRTSHYGEVNLTFLLNLKDFIKDPTITLKAKVKEKGAGWTKSCGTGATAAAAYILRYNYHKSSKYPIKVEQEGGVLEVHHDNSGSLKLVGPSELEYDGVWDG